MPLAWGFVRNVVHGQKMKTSKILIMVLMFSFLMTSISFADTLKTGSTGQQVKDIQLKLKKLGFFSDKATGYFGSKTKAAVIKFQKKKGLKSDGMAGVQTMKALSKAYAGTAIKVAARGNIDRKQQQKVQLVKADAENISDADSDKEDDDKDSDDSKNADEKSDKVYGEMLDWWTEVDKIFYRGAVAKVTDVRTGKSYYVKRTYGRNHADCEALTKEDADIMKEVWGGEWNWSRRPIVVEIDGIKIAASSNGMPHAGLDSVKANINVKNRSQGYGYGVNLDTVKGNGQNGHFCIHFLNSRTHGSNKVDAKHQAAVKEAAGK